MLPAARCAAALGFFHQRGIMTKTPSVSPQAKAASTTKTNGACHKVPKKKYTATVCWLFNAKAKSVKKMAAFSSQVKYFNGNPLLVWQLYPAPERKPYQSDALADRHQFFGSCIDSFPQCLSRLEMWHPFFRNGDTFSGPRITPHAGRTPIDGKAAKTPDFDAVATHQCFAHGLKKCLDGIFGVAVRQLAKSGSQFFN